MESNGLLWCCRRGAHAKRVPRRLLKPCVESPRSRTYRWLLSSLRKGRLPRALRAPDAGAFETCKPRRVHETEPPAVAELPGPRTGYLPEPFSRVHGAAACLEAARPKP